MYGIKLWWSACAKSIRIRQRFQSNTLLQYERNESLHRGLEIPTVNILWRKRNYLPKVQSHTNPQDGSGSYLKSSYLSPITTNGLKLRQRMPTTPRKCLTWNNGEYPSAVLRRVKINSSSIYLLGKHQEPHHKFEK